MQKPLVFVLPNEEQEFPLVARTYKLRPGFNSEVLIIRFEEGGGYVEKRIGALRGGFSLAQAGEIIKDVTRYQQELKRLGVPLPPSDEKNFSIRYDAVQDLAHIYFTCGWTGFDIEQAMKTEKALGRNLQDFGPFVVTMCAILKCVCRDRKLGFYDTNVGIDPKPSNFTISPAGMTYVDPFPPRYRKHGEPIIEWHPLQTRLGKELGYFKYYDWRGILMGLTAQLARLVPELKVFFEDIVLGEFRDVAPSTAYDAFLQELSQAPWRRLRRILQQRTLAETDMQQAEDVMWRCFAEKLFGVDYHVYTLREFALELACAKLVSPADLEQLFRDSHFEEEMPKPQLEKLQTRLCGFLRSQT